MTSRAWFRWSLLGVLLALLIAGIAWWGARRHRRLEACLQNLFQVAHPQYKRAVGRTYSTSFPNAEDPISENHNWINGGTCDDPALCPGAATSNVKTLAGLAFGTQPGDVPPPYTDSGAILSGDWGSDQFVQIVVHWDGTPGTTLDYDEVEIRLRGTFVKNGITTYNKLPRRSAFARWVAPTAPGRTSRHLWLNWTDPKLLVRTGT
jgi:hypothetical protein